LTKKIATEERQITRKKNADAKYLVRQRIFFYQFRINNKRIQTQQSSSAITNSHLKTKFCFASLIISDS